MTCQSESQVNATLVHIQVLPGQACVTTDTSLDTGIVPFLTLGR